jgi:hypothetical protein
MSFPARCTVFNPHSENYTLSLELVYMYCTYMAAMLKIASWMTPWRGLSQGWSSSGESVHMLLRCGILAKRIHTMPLLYHAGWMTPWSGLFPGWSSPWQTIFQIFFKIF